MKRIQYHNYGGPDVMKLEAFELASPGKNEVAVKIKFAAINPIDWKLRGGQMKIVTGKSFPRAMGMDFSGIVIAVGSNVTRFKAGDAVFGLARFKESGALGEAVITKEAFLARKPDDVSFEQAACLGTPGMTAWNGLRDKAGLTAGQRVFVNGCSGAVGEASVQIARMVGANVTGSCSDGAMERARLVGVDTVYDYQKTELSTLPERFDVVYDTAATIPLSVGLNMLRKGGVLLDLNPSPGKFIRSFFDKRLKPVICTPRPDVLDTLAQAAQNGSFRLPVAEVVPLSDAIELIAAIEGGRKLRGKALVAMD